MIDLKKTVLAFLLFIIVFSIIAFSVPAAEEEIVFAISPMASSVSTFTSYHDFIDYLSEKTGKRFVLKQRRTYSEINNLLKTGKAQFSLTCTGAFLSGIKEFDLELLAIPMIDGKTTYNSYLIVNKESGINNFQKLKGKVFAFTDPLSFTGRLYTLHLLESIGTKPEKFFRKTFYTASHEKSIKSVAYGLADGASVDSLIFEDMKRMNDPAIEKIKVIKVSKPFGMPPIVISPATTEPVKLELLDVLISMSEDTKGKEILEKLQIDKFVRPDLSIYETAIKLRESAIRAALLSDVKKSPQ